MLNSQHLILMAQHFLEYLKARMGILNTSLYKIRSDFKVDKLALVLVIIGALNWGSIGLFQFDLVAWLCGGQAALFSRIIYTLVAIAGIWCITLLFRDNDNRDVRSGR